MPMLVTQNLKDRDLLNMMRFNIQDIVQNDDDDDDITFRINNQLFSYDEFRESFIPAFCVTVHRCQGGTINTHYSISNVNKLDKKQLRTALSRTTKLKYIHLDNNKLNNKYIPKQQPVMETVNSYFNDIITIDKYERSHSSHVIKYTLVVQSGIYKTGYMST